MNARVVLDHSVRYWRLMRVEKLMRAGKSLRMAERNPTELDAVQWAVEGTHRGAGEILLTSMDADGTKEGFDLELTRTISEAVPVPVIASGGAGTLEHMAEAVTAGKADAVLAASIFHFGEFTVEQTKQFMQKKVLKLDFKGER